MTDSDPVARYVRASLAVFGALAAGALLAALLTLELVEVQAGLQGGLSGGPFGQTAPANHAFWYATVAALGRVMQLGLVLGAVIGIYSGFDLPDSALPVTAGVAGATIAAFATMLVLAALVVVLAPSSVSVEFGELLKSTIGATVGVAVATAGGAYATGRVLASSR